MVGGGIAGLAAATELAERGASVTILEREDELGGRVRSWPVTLPRGQQTRMSRGFHAFFRQYYQLRALLRRADPELTGLRPVADYPLQLPSGVRDSFAGIPRTPPWNIAGFVARSPSFRVRDLAQVDVGAALGLMDVEVPRTLDELDGMSAADVLDRLRFPDSARHLALEVFARSFFADPREFSGAELVTMFHTYFVGSAEGLLFDVAADDFGAALWDPLARYLERLGVDIRTGTTVGAVSHHDAGFRLESGSESLEADAVVLATDLAPLQRLVTEETSLGTPEWRESVARLRQAPPFLVWRRWFDRPTRPGAPEFLGTSGYARLDNVSLPHLYEESARSWADAHGGSVVELHAYALAPGADEGVLRAEMQEQQDLIHPELVGARQLGEQWLVRDDCPVVDTAPWRQRPGVVTPTDGLVLAGDGIRCELPVALMERAATTGVLAANHLLARWGSATADVWTTPVTPRVPGVSTVRRLVSRS